MHACAAQKPAVPGLGGEAWLMSCPTRSGRACDADGAAAGTCSRRRPRVVQVTRVTVAAGRAPRRGDNCENKRARVSLTLRLICGNF